MVVKFYNLSKRTNSTKQPTGAGVEHSCVLKSASGILDPVIELQLPITSAPSWNYAYISDYGRYYWVTDAVFRNRLWEISLKVDPLASFKSDIGSSSLYVLRSSAQHSEYVVDTHYPITTETNVVQTLGTTAQWWQTTDTLLTTGSFVVGLRGRINADQTAGGITYLTMTPAQFKTFTEDLFDDSLNNYVPSGTVLDIGNALALMILNPTQYIASCLWIPGTPSQTQAATGFNVGWWGFTSGAGILTPASTLSYNTTITLTDHPQAATRGRFLNCQPFTSRLLHLPRYGVVDVSNHIPANALQLYITLNVDPLSGQGLYKIYYRTQLGQYPDLNLIDEIQCQIGVEMPLSSNQITIQDVISSVTSLASAAYDAASFNGIGAAADIASSLQILQPHINDISSASGFLGYPGDIGAPYMFSYFRLVAAEDNTEEGRPYCQISTPATLTGYMQVLHGDIMSSNATARELEEIRADLEGGFYYE